jgi:hypothetical protein
MAKSVRLEHAEHISTRLYHLSVLLRTFSRNGLNNGSIMLEPICAKLFNTLWGWQLISTNLFASNYPALDLIDKKRRLGVQITSSSDSEKVKHTLSQLSKAGLKGKLDRVVIFFLLPAIPGGKKKAAASSKPKLEVWSISELLGKMLHDGVAVTALGAARAVLDAELGDPSIAASTMAPQLWARFKTGRSGKVLRCKKSYCMDLWLTDVPCKTKRARFKVLDESFDHVEWNQNRKRGKALGLEFLTDDMNSYGDVLLRAQGGLEGPTWRIETTLYHALVRTHGNLPKDQQIRKALFKIRDN